MGDAKQEIRSFIVAFFLFGQSDDLADDASLLERGIIDSTGVLELVAYLEKTFHIKIENDELIPENLDSIDAIATFLEQKGLAPHNAL
jgi:acyl carrier protein